LMLVVLVYGLANNSGLRFLIDCRAVWLGT
jgi:hypothetical protein